MSYSTGMMNKRVAVLSRMAASAGEFGRGSGGQTYVVSQEVWAAIDFVRGLSALREGALDAYDTVMIRMRWNPTVTRESLLWHDGRMYEVQQLNSERQRNQMQITAQERPDLEQGVYFGIKLKDCNGVPLLDSNGIELFAKTKTKQL